LKREERKILELQAQKEKADNAAQNVDRCALIWKATTPLRIAVGTFFLLVSLLIITSLSLSSIDKLIHSTCKTHCGWTVDSPSLPNPVDIILNALSEVFPIDYFLFALLVIYLMLCTVSALVSLGVRIIFFKLHDVRKAHTMPNALLLGCWFLMFIALSMNMEILTLSPQYTAFGSQFYYPISNGTFFNSTTNETIIIQVTGPKTKCSVTVIDTVPGMCVLSQVARFVHLINIQLPFFGVILFFGNLVFIGIFFLFLGREVICSSPEEESYQTLKERAEQDAFFAED